MRRALIVIVVGAVAFVLGAAVAGRPQGVTSDVMSSRLPKAMTTSSTLAVPGTREQPRTTALRTTTTSTPVAVAQTTVPELPAPLVPESALRIVVANATNINGVAARTVEALRPFGYTNLLATDALADRAETIIVHVDGLSGEAQRLAAQIGLDPARVRPRQAEDLTVNREDGDVWLLIAADRVPP